MALYNLLDPDDAWIRFIVQREGELWRGQYDRFRGLLDCEVRSALDENGPKGVIGHVKYFLSRARRRTVDAASTLLEDRVQHRKQRIIEELRKAGADSSVHVLEGMLEVASVLGTEPQTESDLAKIPAGYRVPEANLPIVNMGTLVRAGIARRHEGAAGEDRYSAVLPSPMGDLIGGEFSPIRVLGKDRKYVDERELGHLVVADITGERLCIAMGGVRKDSPTGGFMAGEQVLTVNSYSIGDVRYTLGEGPQQAYARNPLTCPLGMFLLHAYTHRD